MDGPPTKVALVAPVFNRRETTLQALRSLRRIKTDDLLIRIFIVDDGSTDGTADAIRSEFPEATVIPGDGTLHYAAGTNLGISAALEWDAEFIVTMNDDAVFHDSFLVNLVETARQNPRSIVGALLLLWDRPHRVFQVAPKWNTMAGGWTFDDDMTAFTVSPTPFEVECIVGNCVIFPAEAIRQVGLMDEKRFPHGWGDAQYLASMKRGGWRLLIDPKSLVWCEPNTYPEPLHNLSRSEVLRSLFMNSRHPLNLKRQFVARWYSAPTRKLAAASFFVYLTEICRKALHYGIGRRGKSVDAL